MYMFVYVYAYMHEICIIYRDLHGQINGSRGRSSSFHKSCIDLQTHIIVKFSKASFPLQDAQALQ